MGSRLSWNLKNGNPALFLNDYQKNLEFICKGFQKSMGSIKPIEPPLTTPLLSLKRSTIIHKMKVIVGEKYPNNLILKIASRNVKISVTERPKF